MKVQNREIFRNKKCIRNCLGLGLRGGRWEVRKVIGKEERIFLKVMKLF